MLRIALICLFFLCQLRTFAQPANNECTDAWPLNARDYCSAPGAFSSEGATASLNNGNDVWFKFTAVSFEVNIVVTGGSLGPPRVGIMEGCSGAGLIGSSITEGNTTTFTKAGLTPGVEYYIWVSGQQARTGTFQICIKNYNPPVKPGQDINTSSTICSSSSFLVTGLTGAGVRNNETLGTCLPVENNSVWYRFVAANNGTLVFTLTPFRNDDLDWVLYDLGPASNPQNPSAANAIRCAAGHGIDNSTCPSEPTYTKTGLAFHAQDVNEGAGCGAGQDGLVRFVTLTPGNMYALIVDNFSGGNNGFTLDFKDINGRAGTAEFQGPRANLQMQVNNPCTPQLNYQFSATAQDYVKATWYFGAGASMQSFEGLLPPAITYAFPGEKTVVLEVINDKGCQVVIDSTFTVAFKPELPIISGLESRYCIGERIELSTPALPNAQYLWTGPMNFSSDQKEISIPVDHANRAGLYQLVISIDGCSSDPASVTVPPIGQTPVPDFEIVRNGHCTPGQSFTFINRSTNYRLLRWDFGENASVSPGAGNERYTVTYSGMGPKTIRLEAEGNTGCIQSISRDIHVSLYPQIPIITANKPDFCIADTIRLSTQEQGGASYHWSGPNGFSSTLREPEIPVSSEAVSGTYTLIVRSGDCETAPQHLYIPPIYKLPQAAFSSYPEPPARLSIPFTVKFFNESQDGDSYLWDFGDGNTSTEVSPEHTYNSTGDFEVSLTVFKSNTCSASVASGLFMLNDRNTIFIPNTFTPNNDGANDLFVVYMSNIKNYYIEIYNRFGTLLFSSPDIFEHWNGMYESEPLPAGSYYYKIEAEDYDGTLIRRSGSISIIK